MENSRKTAIPAFARLQLPFQVSTNIQIFSTVRHSLARRRQGCLLQAKNFTNPNACGWIKPFCYNQVNFQQPCLICSSLTGMAIMAKEQNYSSLVPCPSLFPSSVRKFFGVLFFWGFFLRRTRIFPGIIFTSLKLSAP